MGSKKTVIVIGAFTAQGGKQNAGGVITATRILMESEFARTLDVLPIDTTAKIEEPFIQKILKASKRFQRLLLYLIRNQPIAMFTWAAGGFSLYEKLVYCLICRFFGVRPVIMFVDSLWMNKIIGSKNMKFFHRILFCLPGKIVCRSKSWVEFYAKMGVDLRKCHIVYNWIDLNQYKFKGRSCTQQKILFVGWLIKEKGVFELIAAFKKIVETNPDIILDMVGGGPELATLKVECRKLGIHENVFFHEWLSNEEVKGKFREAMMLVLPSHGEGFPYVIVEAMASKVPVITTPVGGIPGVLKDGFTAFFSGVGDVEQLCEKMQDIISNKVDVDFVVNNAYRHVAIYNDINVTSSKLIDLLIR